MAATPLEFRHVLVTGAAGFIGYHVSELLLQAGVKVLGVDCLNDYYSVQLKRDRLALLQDRPGFEFQQFDLADRSQTAELLARHGAAPVIHLAAQAGVRYAIENPAAYVDSNLVAFSNILEGCRHAGCPHLLFASSSSVYGANAKLPFHEDDPADHPVSFYAATKRSNELLAHSYSHLFSLPTTGLRFFTVYGPWGRPDMALALFAEAMLAGRPVRVFNEGRMSRDFTYVEDVAAGVVSLLGRPPQRDADGPPSPARSSLAPYRLYNLGGQRPMSLLDWIGRLEQALGVKAELELLPMQPGDVPATFADIAAARADAGFEPRTTIDEGLARFAAWYREYHA